ncbi:MAG: RluA family pseudouridine synthase [Acidimicrobiales bacterium]
MKVPLSLDGVRIDRAVAMVTGLSRSAAAELVAAGRVRIAGRPAGSRSAPLVAGTDLEIDVPPPVEKTLIADGSVPFDVVHEDSDVVVVDKPPGVVVHPGAGHDSGTLVAGLLARYPDLAGVGDRQRPGIVHRLDRGTSGLLVVARNPAAMRSLSAQLAARTAGRRYLALVAGHVGEDRGAVEAPIGRSERHPVRMAVSERGRPARTTYIVLRRLDLPVPSTLLAVRLETGRTHQIRVHLSAIGHPVLGDERYGGAGTGSVGLAAGRLALHAAELSFDHPTSGQRNLWSAPCPADLTALIGGDIPALS